MTARRQGPAARLPLRVVVAVTALAAVLLVLASGLTGGTRISPSVPVRAPAGSATFPHPAVPADPPPAAPDPTVPAAAFPSAGTRPHTDDAYVAACTLLVRPPRDAGDRTVPAGPLLFTPPHTPRVPSRPARPAPVSGHAPGGTAHVPSDLGRAPPVSSST